MAGAVVIIKFIKRILAGFQFLTIVPTPRSLYSDDATEIGKSSAWFSVTGLFIGVMSALVWFVAKKFLPADVSCFLVIVVTILLTGGLHLDGLSDTFDAIAARGKSQEERLNIMKSGVSGPIGVAAMIVIIFLKYLLLKNLTAQSAVSPLYILTVFPIAGRFAATACLYLGKSAKEEGLGFVFISNTGLVEILTCGVLTIFIASGANFIFNHISDPLNIIGPPVLTHTGVYIFSMFATAFLQGKFGGITGDHAGAIIEGGEIIFLLAYSC
ncbi:adenosylcobinamide-GDP ribazoletransferase [Candidatus Magnetomonas plexicatena]|uniref:adenosylcobinamide-GDP ribazoletransferase n=1 Tax=Candidatus Magnetomonas plexicatena TaxID=2552947 RepID=UPI001C77595D|nr:adenosylcobinamide-GDP ribazoletransferase [Nitrospirales bacterium LBB_01]